MKSGRRLFGALATTGLVATLAFIGPGGPVGAASAAREGGRSDRAEQDHRSLPADAPGPNPWLAYLTPEAQSEVDWSYWQQWARDQAAEWDVDHPGLVDELQEAEVVEELEAPGETSGNDTIDQAQDVTSALTDDGPVSAVRITGELAGLDGAEASETGPSEGAQVVVPGTLGDDADAYTIGLDAGDVLTLSGRGAAELLQVYTPTGQLAMDSIVNVGGNYPASSPLLKGGNVTADHVAQQTGTYRIVVDGNPGAYELEALVFRPGFEGRSGQQTIFLDFDGATVDTRPFGGSGTRTLSPLSSWLSRWGLSASQEDALIDAVTASVEENLALQSANPGLSVQVLNSKDDPDPFGQPDVSRVIVGGSIAESGINTIGIAESIDPGNFDGEETALVLLDVLSQPGSRSRPASINTYLTTQSDRVGFVGEVLGNVTAHEIGHYLGSWHTSARNGTSNIMDEGGAGHSLFYGVGSDGVGGTADDRDVDFGADQFSTAEAFLGTENTAVRSGWALAD